MSKPHTTKCPVCRKVFRAYPSYVKRKSRVYCSPACRAKSREARRRERWSLHTCPVCKKKFEGYDLRNPKYCSVACYRKAVLHIVTRTCKTCGKNFSGKYKIMKNRIYCSRSCYHKDRVRQLRGNKAR